MHPLRLASTTLFVALSLGFVLPAQDTKTGYRVAQFVPHEYLGEVVIDRVRLEECELWDGVARSPLLGMLDGQLRGSLGFGMTDVDSLRLYPGDRVEERNGYRGTLLVLRGEGLSLEGLESSDEQKVERERFGPVELVRIGPHRDRDPMCWLQPEPGVLVMGDAYIIEPVLDGDRSGVGVPTPGLMPLQKAKGMLAQMAFHFPNGSIAEDMRLPIPELDEEDPLRNFLIRLSETGDGEAVTLEVMMEFTESEGNATRVLEMAKSGLEQAEQHPRFAAMKGLWEGVEFSHEGAQIRAKLPMGDAREASGRLVQLASLAPLLFFAEAESAPRLQPLQPVPAAPAQPAEPQPKGGQGGGER